jgi:drug/metabolite transporter (DMT)-like permease
VSPTGIRELKQQQVTRAEIKELKRSPQVVTQQPVKPVPISPTKVVVLSLASLVCLQLESMILGSVSLPLTESLYYTFFYNAVSLFIVTRVMKVDSCRILRQNRMPLLLRTVFAVSTVVCFVASSQFLSTSYSTFLLVCGALLCPFLAEAELKEQPKIADVWTIRIAVAGALLYLMPFESPQSNHWSGEFFGLIAGLVAAVSLAYQ